MNLLTIYDAKTHACIFSEPTRAFAPEWERIADFIAGQFGCRPEMVASKENGDLTANGVVVAYTH